MAARLVEVIVPDAEVADAKALIERHCRRFWRVSVPGPFEQFSCLVQSRYVERFLEDIEKQFGNIEGFEAVVVETEALVPPLEESRATALPITLAPPSALEAFFSRDRLSTDELHDDIAPSVQLTPAFLAMVVLSAIIAALGMRAGNTAVVIGAMVVAPLLGPSMGLALGATVGDGRLARRAAVALAAGALAAVAVTFLLGLLIDVDPGVDELRLRASVKPSDVALALASGTAGVLAFSRGRALSLVGVMIAVALVPPLAAAGLFLAHGHETLAYGALYLFVTNLVAVNLAGIASFLAQGLPPKSWRMTGGILAVWALVLLLFLAAISGRALFGIAAPALPYL
ncbi:TIGR00341 family protein [Sphingomicrobium nitratireducens]|uniref:TIGR00341 family protein n=1 Tax=Sphingomicrobium nitratireducens TaxID=2964666 RepID=UPI0022409015|nr:TIGR00341 family protein [Sphingomicrobium nitratireducens]